MGTCCNGSSIWTSLTLAGVIAAGSVAAVSFASKDSDESTTGETITASLTTSIESEASIAPDAQPDVQMDAQPDIQPDDDMAQMMQAWMEFGAPDEHHQPLKAFVGDWKAHTVSTMAPGAPPEESIGSETNQMILGGRYVTTHHKGNFSGMPFEGYGTMGYDKTKKKYTSVWMDNFSTTISNSTGSYDAATKTWTMHSKMKDLMGNTVQQKSVHKIINDDKRTLTFYERRSSDEEWYQSMIITYTRN